ncbi:unnamed protein product [Gordionus sp. m RMFG-2023]|uniref:probable cytosol aminopeptidase isoform X2 n=1 Tax=Gordionus sp. m RMFG-2023 TaxID=3053472 RepID=UPI0030E0A4C4
MKRVNIRFSTKLLVSDWDKDSLLIAGQPQYLSALKYDDVKIKLEPKVSKDLFQAILNTSKCDKDQNSHNLMSSNRYFPIFLDREGGILMLPPTASNHNCPNRPHSLAKFLGSKNFFCLRYTSKAQPSSPSLNANLEVNRESAITPKGSINLATISDSKSSPKIKRKANKAGTLNRFHCVVVCEYRHILSYTLAIARSYPAYSAKSSGKITAEIDCSNADNQTDAMSENFDSAEGNSGANIEPVEQNNGLENDMGDGEKSEDVSKPNQVIVQFLIAEYSPTANEDISKKDNVIKASPVKFRTLSEQDIYMLNQATFGTRMTSVIVDMPCNVLSTNEFVQEIQRIGDDLGIVPKIIRGADLEIEGFGGIYGVGKAAVNPPALVILSHEPPNSEFNIAWVGKGIVYDTGGLSIKGKSAMLGMKRDCGGAAAILGAFYSCVKLGFSHTLHAVFCLAENSVGPNATRPDDIHTMYSGKTVEINNTDAEGRLVLADGVSYASNDLNCDIILDMATLTGAQGIATGKYHAALITNNSTWENYCVDAGKSSGDLVYPLPYCPELHFSEFSSSLADMKNSVADRSNAQASCASLFIASHLKNGFDFPGVWLHVDMAYPVHSGERATGYGVGLLLTLFGFGSHDPYLKSHCPIRERHSDKSQIGNNLEKNKINVLKDAREPTRENAFLVIEQMMKEHQKRANDNNPEIHTNNTYEQDDGIVINVHKHMEIRKSILSPNSANRKKRLFFSDSEPILKGGY